MSSQAGLQPLSHFLSRWMPDSSRAGVFLDQSPAEVVSVRPSSSSSAVEEFIEDSFCLQFAPLPVSMSSSCVSVDSVVHTQSRRDQGYEKSSSDWDLVYQMGTKPQALVDRLDQVKFKTLFVTLPFKKVFMSTKMSGNTLINNYAVIILIQVC